MPTTQVVVTRIPATATVESGGCFDVVLTITWFEGCKKIEVEVVVIVRAIRSLIFMHLPSFCIPVDDPTLHVLLLL